MSAISQGLRGAGEAVHVALEQDGWWYLSGNAVVPLDAMDALVPWPPRQGRPEVTSYAWRRGDAPVKMIHKSEVFCLLTGIGVCLLTGIGGGGFCGGGEQVETAIGVDDFRYLRGKSELSGIFGETRRSTCARGRIVTSGPASISIATLSTDTAVVGERTVTIANGAGGSNSVASYAGIACVFHFHREVRNFCQGPGVAWGRAVGENRFVVADRGRRT